MEDSNSAIFAQAKIEYSKQLIDTLVFPLYEGFRSIYEEARILKKSSKKDISIIFREQLQNVPKWNNDIIEKETIRILQVSCCDWLDDLITAVFLSHTKILTALGPNKRARKVNLTIPKNSTFIHKTYINIARELWKNPYLFNENVKGYDFQKNIKTTENIIKEGIEYTVRKSLPVKEILREHLDINDISSENEDYIKTQRLKALLKNELDELNNNSIEKLTQ